MDRVDKLLTGYAVDYSKRIAKGLVADILFPTVKVDEPSGKFQVFGIDAERIPDTALASNGGSAKAVSFKATTKQYSCEDHALKENVDKKKLEYTEGAFAVFEKKKVDIITKQLRLAREKKTKEKLFGVSGRSQALSGTTGNTAKWAGGKGEPVLVIKAAIEKLAYRPNTMVIAESVFDTLEFHPKVLAALGEINTIKQVTPEILGKIFRIENVLIAKGKADFGNRKADNTVASSSIWGNTIVLAYVSEEENEPCVGKTFKEKQDAQGNEYLVRKWDSDEGGLKGSRTVQVGTSYDVNLVCEDMFWLIKDCI